MIHHFLQNKSEYTSNSLDYQPYQYGFKIDQYEQQIDLKSYDVALLYTDASSYIPIRTALYQLAANFKKNKLLNVGLVVDEPLAITETTDKLLQAGVLPLLISPNKDAVAAQFKAFEQRYELLNVALFDSKIAYSKQQDPECINQLMETHPHLMIHLSSIAYQTYLNDPDKIALLEDKYFDSFRLGYIQQNLREVEPITRDIDFAAFSLASIRAADAPANQFRNPNGLTAMEACKVMHYLGLADRLSAICVHGFEMAQDQKNQSAHLLAQMIWHLIEGFNSRKNELYKDKSQWTAYVVDNKIIGNLAFYKSKKSDRWWFEIPQALHKKHHMIACSYRDYQLACEGELSDRLLNAMHRLQ